MKIVFVNPPYIHFEGIRESGGHGAPLNLAYLAAYLRQHISCQVSILDAEILGLSYLGIEEKLREMLPDIVGMTSPTPAMNHVAKIAEIAKKINRGCIVIVGGPHPSGLPEQTAQIPNIDFVVIGEGELTLLELVEAVQSKETSFSHIDGLAYKLDDRIIITNRRSLIENLDTIPFPARDLLNLKLYHSTPTKKVSGGESSTPMLTGRGCPYNCIYCISNLIWQRRYRVRSPQNIVDEIEECVNKYNLTEFNFHDDAFTFLEDHVINVCKEIQRRKLDISWVCFGRIGNISRNRVVEMKKAGCKMISFGIESGSQEILKLMRKNITMDQISQDVKIVKDEGVAVHASFMLGNIGETRETAEKTIKLAKKLDIDNATFFITTPFPGTDLYKIALQKGYITQDSNWGDFAPLTKSLPPLVQDNLTHSELLKLQKRAFLSFYLRPRFVFKKLQQIHSLSDLKSLLEGLGIFFGVQSR
ncbi:MAG: cobalamin-dependent protein [Dehalococcoidia bacterium]|nr:MAG: cobalamin-dependent protein [Dehalococcoidia bacterium]